VGRDHLGYEYTGLGDSSRLHEEEIDDEWIVERLGKIFKCVTYQDLGGVKILKK
jgi:N-acetylglutamate synthase-like GNAT family acetyltransferase